MTGKNVVSSPSFCYRRKYSILCILGTLTILFFVIREKYFYRADVLIAMSAPRITDNEQRVQVQIESKVSSDISDGGGGGGFLTFFGFGSKTSEEKVKKEKKLLNPWDEWMLKHTEMTSIGDIYNKCGELLF